MTNLYSQQSKKIFFDFDSCNNSKTVEIEVRNKISKGIYDSCTTPLLVSLLKMNSLLSRQIIRDILSKGMK